jgi:hypothetical protein
MRARVRLRGRAYVRVRDTTSSTITGTHPVPLPVPEPELQTSSTGACECDLHRAGRTACVRVIALFPRNVTAPSPMKTAPPRSCARHRSGAGPPWHVAEGPTGARVRRRRTVALVSEIATPSNTSSPLNIKTAPPYACTRADAERWGAHPSHRVTWVAAQPRRGTAHATDMRVHAPHTDAVRANKHVCMLRWLFDLLESPQELPVGHHSYFTSTTTAHACSNCCRLGTRSSATASASASAAS